MATVNPPAGVARPAPGDVLELGEDHYKFGAGPLVCRVGSVIARVTLDGRTWWHVRGQCKRGTAATLLECVPWTDRELYIDAAAVRSRPESRGDSAGQVLPTHTGRLPRPTAVRRLP